MIPALASVALSFKQVQSNILKIVKIKEQEKLQKKFDDNRSKQQLYKSRFQKPTQLKKISAKDNSQLSLMSIISGLSGLMKALFVIVGMSGLFSIIKKSGIGEYIFKFVKDSLSSIIDLIKKTITFVRDVFSDSNVQKSIYDLAVAFFSFLGTLIVTAATLIGSLLRDSEVIETLKNVVVAVFKAVVEGIKASYEIISKLVMDNWETIKQTTFDVFIEIKNALILSLQTLGSIFAGGIDPRISSGIKEIFVAAWDFIATLFTTEFKDPETGKSVTLLHEGLTWVAKMGALAAAWTVFGFYLREKGKQLMGMSFQDLKNSACDCMDLDLPDRDKKGGKGGSKPKPKAEIPKEKSWKDSIKEGYDDAKKKVGQIYESAKEGAKKIYGKVTEFGERVYKKAANLGKGIYSWVENRLKSTGRIFKAIGKNPRILKKIGTRIATKLGEKAVLLMSRVAIAAAGVTTGGIVTAIMAVLAVYDTIMLFYGIYELLFVSTDGEKQDGGYYPEIKAEVEQWLKDNPDTTPTPAVAPVAAPATAPVAAPATKTTSKTASTSTSSPAATSTTPKTSSSAATPIPASASASAPSSSPSLPAASMTTPSAASMPNVSANVENRKVDGLGFGGPRTTTKGVIIHHTGGSSLDVAIKTLQSRKLSYHYLVDRNGRIVNILPDNLVGWHAGHTNKKPELNNSNTISISMVAKDDTDVTPEQLAAASALEAQLAKKYGFPKSESYGHGEVSSHKHPKEGFTIATAIRGGKEINVMKDIATQAVEDVRGATNAVGPTISQAVQTGGQVLDSASNQLTSSLRVLEDLFIKGRPSFTDLSTTMIQNNTISRPGGDLRNRETNAIKFLIERQTA